MADYTSNLGMKKPSLDDDALVTDINNNMDILDTAVNGVQDGLAIVADGNTHAAISAGQFVYVRNHSTLTEGLYVASSSIAANATLSTSNLTADSAGGLNSLNGKTDYFSLANGRTKQLEQTENLANITRTGLYFCNGCSGSPSGTSSYGFLMVEESSPTVVTQRYRPYDMNDYCDYVRIYANGTWQPWYSVNSKIENIDTISEIALGISGLNLYKIGKIRVLRVSGYHVDISSTQISNVIPSGHRPNTLSRNIIANGNASIIGILGIFTNGALDFTISSSGDFYGEVVYLAD